MDSINGTKAVLEEWIKLRIFLDFWVHLIGIGRLKETLRESGNDILEEMIYVAMECIVAVPKINCNVLIRGVGTQHV